MGVEQAVALEASPMVGQVLGLDEVGNPLVGIWILDHKDLKEKKKKITGYPLNCFKIQRKKQNQTNKQKQSLLEF